MGEYYRSTKDETNFRPIIGTVWRLEEFSPAVARMAETHRHYQHS